MKTLNKVSVIDTLNKNNPPFLKTILFLFLMSSSFVFAQNNWDGDNAVGNFTFNNNWYSDIVPGTWNSTTDLNFNYNNGNHSSMYYDFASWVDAQTINFISSYPRGVTWDSNGNGINFYAKFENNSNFSQAIRIPLSYLGSSNAQVNPVNGDLIFDKFPIYNNNNKNFEIYGNNSKLLSFGTIVTGSQEGYIVGDSNVNLYLKQNSKVLWDVNNAAAYSGGTFIENGEFWIGKSGKLNGTTIQVGNGNSNTCKLFLSDASIATTASNTIVVPTSSTNSYIGGLNSSNIHTFSGTVNLNNNTVNLEEVSSTGTLLLSGAISGTGGGIKTVGVGTVRLSSTSNNYTGSTTTQAGILQLGASSVIPDASPIVLNGGTFSTGATTGFSETAGTLQLSNNSTIALGTGSHTLTFAASNLVAWPGTTLTITGWTGGSCSATGGRIFFGAASGTLTAAQLAKISFTGYAGTATLLATGEIVPTVYVTAALNGIYYIPSSCYPTVASAVTALNTNGIAGPVTFNVAAGHTETAPLAGYSLTATGTAANPIVFQKNGVGTNPTITAPAQTAGTLTDAVFKIIGGDYITIDGFTMQERSFSPTGTDTTPATNTMTEFGVAFFAATGTNGAKNNTIQNCSISLNKTYVNSFGIYSNTQHTATTTGTGHVGPGAGISNSNNKIYGNSISNVNFGIVMIGLSGTTTEDAANDIGGTVSSTGNILNNIGNANSSAYNGLTTNVCGIQISNCTNINIRYNTITASSSGTSVHVYGIYLKANTSPSVSHTSTISNNIVTVTNVGSSNNVFGIWNEMTGAAHTLNITNNQIVNCTTSTAFTGSFCGINCTATGLLLGNYNNNIISNNTIAGVSLPTSTSARCALIKVISTAVTTNVTGNTCNNNQFTNTGSGDIVAFDVNGNYTGACTISNNLVEGLTPAGNGLSTTGTGSITGYSNTNTPSGALTISGNTFKNVTVSVGGISSWIRFVHSVTGASQVLNINTNTIENLTLNTGTSSSGIIGINTGISTNVSIYNNTIKTILSGGVNIGIQTSGNSGSTHTIYGNTIDGMTSSVAGGASHYGIYISPTTGTSNIYNNKVYNISSGTSTNASIYGIYAGFGTTSNVYNNMVGDIKMPNVTNTTASVLRGIHMSTATNNVYNNTVYLNASSTGADFSSSAFSFSGTGNLDLRNNIFINNSTPNGQGFAAAIMRVATGINGTVSANYASTSNNNCLYAPSVTNGVIFVEGQYTGGGPTNVYQANCFDINAFKTFVSTRETNSFSELPTFINITSGSMDLHLAAASTSACINGGQTIALTASDIDGNSRPISSAYEIGADETAGTAIDRIPPTINYTVIPDVGCSSATVTLSATITDTNAIGSGATAPRLYYKKSTDATNTIATVNNNTVNGWKFVTATGSGPYSFTLNFGLLPGGLIAGDIIQYFVAAQDVAGNVATTNANVQTCPTSVVFTSSQTVSSPPTINQFTYRALYSGNYTVGASGTFATITGANGLFDSINKGYISGDVTVSVISDIAEDGLVALNEWTEYNSGTCALTGTTVYRLTIQSDGTIRNITGTNLVYNSSGLTTSLKSLINLNGADRVTFTGGTAAQRNLVFRSTNTTPTSCIPVFQMGNVNGSNDIIIKNCDIQSNGTSGASPTSAGIYITNTGTNSNNLFELNDIHNAVSGTAGNPRFGIFAENNTATVVQIKNNNIYNIFNKAIQLGVSSIGDNQVITGNSIYYNTGSLSVTFSGIEINASTASSGHTITGNYIGGTTATGGTSGSQWNNSTVTTFKGIVFGSNGSTNTTTIANNYIGNLNLSNTSGVAFSGIDFTGKVDCNNNTIGHATDSAMGVIIGATTATGATNNYGIIGGTGTAVAGINFTNNTVKYLTHRTNGAAVTNSRLIGIYNYYTGAAVTINMNNNIVSDMTSNMKNTINLYTTGNAYGTGGILCGILSGTVSTSSININNNTIFNLSNTGVNSTNIPNVIGIAVDGNTPSNVSGNKIYGLTNQSPGSAANPACIMGIRFQPSTSVASNNMITLTNGANTNKSRIIGIFDGANNLNVYFNSVLVGGSQSDFGTTGICSAPYASISSSGTHNIRNNIFLNTRTTTAGSPAGVNFHYSLAVTTTGATTVSNYNDLVAADTNRLCLYNTTSYTLANWRLLVTPATPDVNSVTITPTFTDSANGDLHIITDSNCAFDNLGIAVIGFTTDYDVDTRAATPDIGADEFTSDFKLNITNPSVLKCTVTSVDLTASAITTGGAGSTTGSALTYWNDSLASSSLASPSSVSTAGTYYIKSVKGTCNDIKPVVVSRQGTTWAGGAWVGSGGYPNGTLPDIETAVVIDDTYDTSVNGSFEACSLIVNSPSTLATACTLTIKPSVTDDGYVTVQNNLTVNTNGTLLVENKGSLIMVNDSGVVTNNGTTQVKRTTTPFERFDYVYWSAPLNDTRTLSNIFSGWRTDYSFTFNTQNFADLNGDSFDDNSDAWTFSGSSATMTKAKGYAIMTPTTGPFSPSATPVTVTFTGAANNGIIPIKEYESANAASTTDDYNLVGNPYPSAIWGKKFINDNGLKTSGTLYFWTHVADVSISNPGPNVYNFITADYALFNLSGGTASGTGSTIPTGYIASGQGFFIEAQNNNVDIEFNNSMRTRNAGYRNDDFFRTSSPEPQRDRLWLNLQNPDGLFSQLLVGYFPETTLAFDWAYDGRVNASNTQVSFYSLAENEKYKIQARPIFNDTDIVPLGYFSIANGQFTISLGPKEGVFDTDQKVYLEDKNLNIIHDLKQSPYTFTTTYGRYEDRFVLRYTSTTLNNPDLGDLDSTVIVATNLGQMTIKSSVEAIQEVTVYDILGRQLFDAKSIGNKDFVASNISMSQQTLIVKIKLENGIVVTRKIIL